LKSGFKVRASRILLDQRLILIKSELQFPESLEHLTRFELGFGGEICSRESLDNQAVGCYGMFVISRSFIILSDFELFFRVFLDFNIERFACAETFALAVNNRGWRPMRETDQRQHRKREDKPQPSIHKSARIVPRTRHVKE
jgi:hypothetical protein